MRANMSLDATLSMRRLPLSANTRIALAVLVNQLKKLNQQVDTIERESWRSEPVPIV